MPADPLAIYGDENHFAAVASTSRRAPEASRRAPEVRSSEFDVLLRLHQEMLRCASSARTEPELIQTMSAAIGPYVQPDAVVYFQRDTNDELVDPVSRNPSTPRESFGPSTNRLRKQLSAACKRACQKGQIEANSFSARQAAPEKLILAAPVAQRGRQPDALAMVFPLSRPTPVLIMIIQMIVSHIVLWRVLQKMQQKRRENDEQSGDTAALLELCEKIVAASDLRDACFTLAGELKRYLETSRVAISIRPHRRAGCRLIAISGVAQFDRRCALARAIESAADECLLREKVTVWPPRDDARGGSADQGWADLAHKNLHSLTGEAAVVSAPLRMTGNLPLGAIMLITQQDGGPIDVRDRLEKFFAVAEASIAGSLSVVKRCEGDMISRFRRTIGRFFRSWRGALAIAGCVAALAAMAVPIPYRVKCDCQIEPVTRRVISAPFDAVLEKTLVKPGDLVHEGDLLAQLDGRRIRWERASVLADHEQAAKKRDAAQAAHRYAEAQIASLEMQRLDQKLRILDHRSQNLDIKSPLQGIVTSGDLERVEGASLVTGQTLMEIAPLQKMLVEIAVPDEDIAYVGNRQEVQIRLDAYPHETWVCQIKRLQPRSEIREQENVFIAEGTLPNEHSRLRPGMKGRAKIATPTQPLGWILFHKPRAALKKMLNW